MSDCFEENLIRHCAATPAGHKCGSLFSYSPDAAENVRTQIDEANVLLADKGIRALLLKACPRGSLVYVYRPSKLRQRLCEPETAAYLRTLGYDPSDAEACLSFLASRIVCSDFPHEIGIFLGYPTEDVEGFIAHKGEHYKLCGSWKVYGDPERAQRSFRNYERCRKFLCNKLNQGVDIYHALKIS